jgi:hypothetical protein
MPSEIDAEQPGSTPKGFNERSVTTTVR